MLKCYYVMQASKYRNVICGEYPNITDVLTNSTGNIRKRIYLETNAL